MKNTNRASEPQKIILRSDELYNGPFSRMMIFCYNLTEIEFWWSKIVLIGEVNGL